MAELDLLLTAKRGDQEAFAQAVQPLENKLFQTALGIVGNLQDAQDVWQNTVLKAWTNLPRLRQPQYFHTWLTRIMLNETKQLLRRRSHQPLLPGDLPDTSVEYEGELEQSLLIHVCLQQIPALQREAIILRYWLDLSLDEMARVLQAPLGTTKTRLYQGQRALKTLIEEADRR